MTETPVQPRQRSAVRSMPPSAIDWLGLGKQSLPRLIWNEYQLTGGRSPRFSPRDTTKPVRVAAAALPDVRGIQRLRATCLHVRG